MGNKRNAKIFSFHSEICQMKEVYILLMNQFFFSFNFCLDLCNKFSMNFFEIGFFIIGKFFLKWSKQKIQDEKPNELSKNFSYSKWLGTWMKFLVLLRIVCTNANTHSYKASNDLRWGNFQWGKLYNKCKYKN